MYILSDDETAPGLFPKQFINLSTKRSGTLSALYMMNIRKSIGKHTNRVSYFTIL